MMISTQAWLEVNWLQGACVSASQRAGIIDWLVEVIPFEKQMILEVKSTIPPSSSAFGLHNSKTSQLSQLHHVLLQGVELPQPLRHHPPPRRLPLRSHPGRRRARREATADDCHHMSAHCLQGDGDHSYRLSLRAISCKYFSFFLSGGGGLCTCPISPAALVGRG